MSKKKKIIIMSSLVFLLAVTAVLNVLLATNVFASTDSTSTMATANYFTTERTTTRSEELLQLDSVIANYEEGSEKHEEAVALKMKIVEMMENELMLETLIKSRGFSDAVVSIGMNSDNVNVFVNANELDYNTALTIYTMLVEEVGSDPGSVIILPVYSQV